MQLRRIGDNAHGRRLRAAEQDFRHAVHLADAGVNDEVAEIVKVGRAPGGRGHRHDHDGRAGGVRFADRRAAGQRGGKVGLRRVDRRLHVARGVVGIARQIELHLDAGRAELAGRGQLVDAGDLADAALQRGRDGGRDGLRIGAGQRGAYPHRRQIRVRQARHRQIEIGDHAREEEPDRQERGPDGTPDE